MSLCLFISLLVWLLIYLYKCRSVTVFMTDCPCFLKPRRGMKTLKLSFISAPSFSLRPYPLFLLVVGPLAEEHFFAASLTRGKILSYVINNWNTEENEDILFERNCLKRETIFFLFDFIKIGLKTGYNKIREKPFLLEKACKIFGYHIS